MPSTGRPRLAVVFGLVAALSAAVPTGAQASRVKGDEEVVLFAAAAHCDGKSWVVPIHGWIFEPEEDSLWRNALLGGLLDMLGISDQQARASALFVERVRWFLVDNERGKEITVAAGSWRTVAGDSRPDGHFRGQLQVPVAEGNARARDGWLDVRVVLPKGDGRHFGGRVRLDSPAGMSVISDIDDTIKITGIGDNRRVLRNTFLRPFVAIPGMARLYSDWAKRRVAVHYLSAGPWHLYSPLSDFLDSSGFPRGPLRLREFRIKDDSRWNLLRSPDAFKTGAIEELMARFPKRRFVLVGDSGERDPEIYAAIARKYPGRVAHILIRQVDGMRMTARRRGEVSAGLNTPLTVFATVDDLPPAIRQGRFDGP